MPFAISFMVMISMQSRGKVSMRKSLNIRNRVREAQPAPNLNQTYTYECSTSPINFPANDSSKGSRNLVHLDRVAGRLWQVMGPTIEEQKRLEPWNLHTVLPGDD